MIPDYLFLFFLCSLISKLIVGNDIFFCLTQKRQKSMKKGDIRKRNNKGDIEKHMDEVSNILEILKDSKLCPQCKMAISKIEGCNKMTCSNCGQSFCYQCKAAIIGYDHFK